MIKMYKLVVVHNLKVSNILVMSLLNLLVQYQSECIETLKSVVKVSKFFRKCLWIR